MSDLCLAGDDWSQTNTPYNLADGQPNSFRGVRVIIDHAQRLGKMGAPEYM